ncbi:MAG: succinylglutamate desuccinylase/aspartoacylase family protein [Beijerinckiaceae bacterium]
MPVIEKLDVEALARGKVHHFWFKGMDTNVGQPWHVPVIVSRGKEAGPRLLLNSGVHGDELNGIRVVQLVMQSIDPQKLKGTVIGIPGLNIPGILHGNRNYIMSDDGGSSANLNRVMPGDEAKGDATTRFAGRIWQKLWMGNVDYVIDMHAQTRGTAYPTFVYADPRNEKVKMLADLIAPDIIKYDAGEKGSVETEFVRANIPAVTYEIGRAGVWQQELIDRSVLAVHRVMSALEMRDKSVAVQSSDLPKVFLGNENISLRATVGGFVEYKVALLDVVVKDQLLARQMNAFGETVAEYKAPHDGKVLSIGDEPVREPGALIVRLIRWNPSEACKLGC